MICNECETVAHCMKNGCIPKQQALDRMAENARELGLDYEPVKQEPVVWKLVPVEPTPEMLKAMDECSKEGYDERLYAGHAASVYMAAIDAAPEQPAQRTWVELVWGTGKATFKLLDTGEEFDTVAELLAAINARGKHENSD